MTQRDSIANPRVTAWGIESAVLMYPRLMTAHCIALCFMRMQWKDKTCQKHDQRKQYYVIKNILKVFVIDRTRYNSDLSYAIEPTSLNESLL